MKTRNWYFFALCLFPLVLIVLAFQKSGAQDWSVYLTSYFDLFKVQPIYSGLSSVFSTASMSVPSFAVSYCSYLVFIVFLRICYEVIVFLPKFCLGVFERKMK